MRLQSSGSTSRLLNLLRLHQTSGDPEAHLADPFFQSPVLNRAMLVKHRLRSHEQELFDDRRTRATKLILAIDAGDLRTGGRFAFVGQRGWGALLASIVGDERIVVQDGRTLELLDGLPSFDPFLLREHLRRADHAPAASYFDIALADTEQMIDYLKGELQPLVHLAGSDGGLGASTTAIARKLMSFGAETEFEPLGRTLRLTPEQYGEGVFCWKGFLYYKWRLSRHSQELPELVQRIRGAQAIGRVDKDDKAYIAEAKIKVCSALAASCVAAADLLKVYDDSFTLMVAAGDPTAFRDFLLNAPSLFLQLGDLIGVVDHITGFWTFRFPPDTPVQVRAEELADILSDFEEVLGDAASRPARPAVAAAPALASALI